MTVARAAVLWVAGLLTAVPYAAYHLFFEASREQYALLITFILFWILGYWGVAGPVLMAVKVRQVFRAIEMARSKDELMAALRSDEGRDVAINLIAAENHVPRFIAERVYELLVARLVHKTK